LNENIVAITNLNLDELDKEATKTPVNKVYVLTFVGSGVSVSNEDEERRTSIAAARA
jgi:hypothetical protein